MNNKRINYLKNPRFSVNRTPLRYEDIEGKPVNYFQKLNFQGFTN